MLAGVSECEASAKRNPPKNKDGSRTEERQNMMTPPDEIMPGYAQQKSAGMTLPKYAWQSKSPQAGGEKDLLASFYGDDKRDTITVELGRCESGDLELIFMRSGGIETCFSREEMAKVLEISNILFAAIK